MKNDTPPIHNLVGADGQGDIYNRLLKNRIVFLGTDVNDEVANFITRPAALPRGRGSREGHLALHQLARRLGHRRHGHLRHHAVRHARRGHHLHGPGRLDGAVPAVRRRAGQALRPAARPHHDAPALGGVQGQASDIAIQAEQMAYIKKLMAERIAEHTGQTVEQIQADSERDRWFTAEQAKDYGIIDNVITSAAARSSSRGLTCEPRRCAQPAARGVRLRPQTR